MDKDKIIRQIQLVFTAIVVMLALFAAFAFYYTSSAGNVSSFSLSAQNTLKSLNILLALAGIPASYMFHKRKVSHIDKEQSAELKVMQYKSAFFIKMITLEGLSLISILIYMVTGQINQLMIFGILYLFMLINFPQKSAVYRDLELNDNDI